MRKQREYKGCELESPIYRQIIAEKRDNSGLHSTMSMPINEYNPKRGKHKLWESVISVVNKSMIRNLDIIGKKHVVNVNSDSNNGY